jgi:hypothetical protein
MINKLIDYYRQGKMKDILDEMYLSMKNRFSIESSVIQYLNVYNN